MHGAACCSAPLKGELCRKDTQASATKCTAAPGRSRVSAYANPNVHMAEIIIPSYRFDVESKVDITAKYGVASET